MRTLLSFEEARRTVVENVPALHAQQVDVSTSLGRTLAEDIISNDTLPPFDNSAMDGFAVRTDDFHVLPQRLTIAGEVPAGTVYKEDISPGTCVSIMTGAPVPAGVDAVVPVEQSRRIRSDLVEFGVRPATGDHIRPSGADINTGDTVFVKGTVITPAAIGMLSSLGREAIHATKAPEVAVISTGSEIVPVSFVPGPGQIRNSNGPALTAMVTTAGGEVSHSLHAADTKSSIRQALNLAQNADVIILSGGVSMGDYDLVRVVLDEMGADWLFWKVRQRPGKPLAFGLLNGRPILGLPGNPVSAAMCFEIYGRPLLGAMLGRSHLSRRLLPARLVHGIKKVKGLHYFSRGVFSCPEKDRVIDVATTGPQGSNLFSSVVRADCIIHIPEEIENPTAGTDVWIEILNDGFG